MGQNVTADAREAVLEGKSDHFMTYKEESKHVEDRRGGEGLYSPPIAERLLTLQAVIEGNYVRLL